MKLLRSSLLAMALLCLVTSCQKDEDFLPNQANYEIDLTLANETDWEMADNVLVLINEHRTSIGLNKIKKDQEYASAYAVDHTQYMIDMQNINHDHFTFRSEGLRSRGASKVGENVAFGYDTAEGVVNAWLNSPGHKAIIEGDYSHSGFGIMVGDNGGYFFTQLFYKQ